ncbi:uncharacterized protein LOC21406290 isoform X3 [Morus notabilis]|uniref:uncharacterized protein LOC21406290 isoform X3 n=1 Tax=Morus notabilis TaxID=981085 RepID=UPI000CED2FE7|nr:uncharacterized protein LOC21406290 isoform X3 [Morus notabilis]
MEKPWDWVRTLVAQLALCFALFFALKLGQPQKSVHINTSESRHRDLHFISVRGGFRPVNQQTHLLKQATRIVPSLKIPWYTTTVSKVHEEGGCFLQQVNVSYGKTLDVIGVNTGLLQDVLMEPLNDTANNQLNWLTRTLEATIGNWCIVVGFHPLIACEDWDREMEASQVFETLHQTFMKFEVNAYISGQDCTQGGISYIENPGSNVKGPYLSSSNGRTVFRREVIDGFLLHRVGSLELVTYFVTLAGEVAHRTVLQQRGKEVM